MIRYVISFAALSTVGALKKPAFLNEMSAEGARTLVVDGSKLVASGAKATFDDVAETMSMRAKHAAERYEWVRKDGLAMVQASASNLWASKLETSSEEEEDRAPRKSLAAVASVISTGLAAGTTAAMAAHYSRREHGDENAEARRFFSRKKDDYDDDDDGDVLRPHYYRPPPGSEAKPQQSTSSDGSAVYHRPINTSVPLPSDAATANCPAYYRQPKVYMGSTDMIPVEPPRLTCYSGSSGASFVPATEKPQLDRPSYYRPRVSKDSAAAAPARAAVPSYKRVVSASPSVESLSGSSYFRDRLPLSAAVGAA